MTGGSPLTPSLLSVFASPRLVYVVSGAGGLTRGARNPDFGPQALLAEHRSVAIDRGTL